MKSLIIGHPYFTDTATLQRAFDAIFSVTELIRISNASCGNGFHRRYGRWINSHTTAESFTACPSVEISCISDTEFTLVALLFMGQRGVTIEGNVDSSIPVEY